MFAIVCVFAGGMGAFVAGLQQPLLPTNQGLMFHPTSSTTTMVRPSSPSSSISPGTVKRPKRDFSMYRTPSGKYYCSCCNITLNSEVQFAQHMDSKKHKTNHAAQRGSNPSVSITDATES